MKLTGTITTHKEFDVSFNNVLQSISKELTGSTDWRVDYNEATGQYQYRVYERVSWDDYDYVTKRLATDEEQKIFYAINALKEVYLARESNKALR
jgi:hypothetical protein